MYKKQKEQEEYKIDQKVLREEDKFAEGQNKMAAAWKQRKMEVTVFHDIPCKTGWVMMKRRKNIVVWQWEKVEFFGGKRFRKLHGGAKIRGPNFSSQALGYNL